MAVTQYGNHLSVEGDLATIMGYLGGRSSNRLVGCIIENVSGSNYIAIFRYG